MLFRSAASLFSVSYLMEHIPALLIQNLAVKSFNKLSCPQDCLENPGMKSSCLIVSR